jgi:hypothetical protein
MKTLNLDALAKVELTVTLNGKDHQVKEMGVDDFIQASAEAEAMKSLDGDSLKENISATIKHLHRVLPTIPETEIRALSVSQLAALVAFVNGTLEDEKHKGEDSAKN